MSLWAIISLVHRAQPPLPDPPCASPLSPSFSFLVPLQAVGHGLSAREGGPAFESSCSSPHYQSLSLTHPLIHSTPPAPLVISPCRPLGTDCLPEKMALVQKLLIKRGAFHNKLSTPLCFCAYRPLGMDCLPEKFWPEAAHQGLQPPPTYPPHASQHPVYSAFLSPCRPLGMYWLPERLAKLTTYCANYPARFSLSQLSCDLPLQAAGHGLPA